MGEKIRDINPIKIGETSLMIELNEGYTKDEGNLIHIQNEKFRYLLKLPDYYCLAATILRGVCEFNYNKQRVVVTKPETEFRKRQPLTNETQNLCLDFLSSLQANKVEYRVLDIQEKLLTVIIAEESIRFFEKVMCEKKAKELPHPLGIESGFVFLYQMKPFRLFTLSGYYIEVYSQLPCASITPKSWIPLDRLIQRQIWEKKNCENGIQWCDDICRFIYHLCWAVFYNRGFSPYEISYLKSKRDLLNKEELGLLLKVVFFKFTDHLLALLKKEDFDSIIPQYFSFIDY